MSNVILSERWHKFDPLLAFFGNINHAYEILFIIQIV